SERAPLCRDARAIGPYAARVPRAPARRRVRTRHCSALRRIRGDVDLGRRADRVPDRQRSARLRRLRRRIAPGWEWVAKSSVGNGGRLLFQRGFGQLLMRRAAAALGTLLLAGCSIAASPSPPTTPVPSAAGSPSTGTSSPSATATATGALRFGLGTDDGLAFPSGLRLESDPSPFARIQARSVSISPDGRRLAYWHVPPDGDDTLGELRSVDLTTGVESTTLLSSAPDRAGGIAWRSDGSALVVATASASLAFGGIDPPPAYTRVHILDLAAGKA